MSVDGVMNLYWIAGLTIYIWVEKMLSPGLRIDRLMGMLLLIWGGVLLMGLCGAVDLGFAVVGPDVGPSRRVRTGAHAANDAVAGMMSSDGWR